MIEQLRKIDKIYDLLALCGSYILNELEKYSYEFGTFKDEEFDGVYDAIERYCCERQQKGHKKAFDELRNYLISFMFPQVTIEKCFAVVKYIDDLVEVEINDKLLGGKHLIKYCAMNEQYIDSIRIIPKMKESFLNRNEIQLNKPANQYSLFRKRRECACSLLDRETVNYMIWDRAHIGKYPTWIYYFNEKSYISKYFYNRNQITFGIVPFTNKPLDEILDVKYKDKLFYINQMHKEAEQQLANRYNDIWKRCEKEDIDFLIFPEMLMTENIISKIKQQEKILSPKIIINGSIWKNYMNKSIVTDGNGKEIFSYYKKEPFKFQKGNLEYKEYLDQDQNKEYVIMEIEGIGRIGVCICKDLISEEVKLFHKHIGTDILIVPAYTKSMDLQASAEELSKEYNCVVVVANACSALGKIKQINEEIRIGFITIPAKLNTNRSIIVKRYMQNECVTECNHGCVGKKIIIDFYKTKEYKEGVSFEIRESSF
ncbi:MAG: hypothetical protein HFG87_01255 [Dorea sp.]|nr:hypothetical protein [Dorea sp.]